MDRKIYIGFGLGRTLLSKYPTPFLQNAIFLLSMSQDIFKRFSRTFYSISERRVVVILLSKHAQLMS